MGCEPPRSNAASDRGGSHPIQSLQISEIMDGGGSKCRSNYPGSAPEFLVRPSLRNLRCQLAASYLAGSHEPKSSLVIYRIRGILSQRRSAFICPASRLVSR